MYAPDEVGEKAYQGQLEPDWSLRVAQAHEALLREGDTLARIGWWWFIAVMVAFKNKVEDARRSYERPTKGDAEPVAVNYNTVLKVSVSIGVSVYPQDGSDCWPTCALALTSLCNGCETEGN